MSMAELTAPRLGEIIGQTIPELFVIIAKNDVSEMDDESLAMLLGASTEEIKDIKQDELYKQVRLLVASEYMKGLTERDQGWDDIERAAIATLSQRLKHDRDPEFNLRVAAVANKAVRRVAPSGPKVLDPAAQQTRIPLTLTRRIVQKISNDGASIEETREISVLDGSAVTPDFKEIDKMLGVSQQPMAKALDEMPEITTRQATQESDDDEMQQLRDALMNRGK